MVLAHWMDRPHHFDAILNEFAPILVDGQGRSLTKDLLEDAAFVRALSVVKHRAQDKNAELIVAHLFKMAHNCG